MKIIIKEGYKAFEFKKGKFTRLVNAGVYSTLFKRNYEIVKIDNNPIKIANDIDLSLFEEDNNFKKFTTKLNAKEGEITFHFINGNFNTVLNPGIHYFWNINRIHSLYTLNMNDIELSEGFPLYLCNKKETAEYFYNFNINAKQIGLLFINGNFNRLLKPGKYNFIRGYNDIDVQIIDSCLVNQDILGQEILTNDKVTIRINCVISYKVNDYINMLYKVKNYKEQIYLDAQLVLRNYICEKSLDEILNAKNEISAYLKKELQKKAKDYFIDIDSASIKDIILPGEIRNIMNMVLIAEKKAQANVITRREEVASTRSLLNTAKLMDDNKTLYKLKELEYIERICEKVGNINISSNGNILENLSNLVSIKKE